MLTAERTWPCGAPIDDDDPRDYCGPCEAGDCEYQQQLDEILEAMGNRYIAQFNLDRRNW